MKIGALILAGGHSSRMNYPKLWLNTPSGKTFLLNLVQTYLSSGVDEIVCVLNSKYGENEWSEKVKEIPEGIKLVYNSEVDLGRIHSIKIGLELMNKMDYTFIQNVDSPFVQKETIQHLASSCKNERIIQPVYHEKKGHPIAVPRKVVNYILKTDHSVFSLRDALFNEEKTLVEVNDKYVLSNINTPESYQKMKRGFV